MKKKEGKQKQGKQKIDFNDLINKNLHDFKMVFDYTGYQFTRLDLSSKSLDILSPLFKEFKYLQHIDLSSNSIVDITHLSALPNLVTLNVQRNNIKDWKAFNVEQGWKTLRKLNLNVNKLTEVTAFNIPNLTELSLIQNKIQKLQTFTGHPKLRKIQLRRNKITSLQGLSNLPELAELYLSQNKIKNFTGLDAPQLRILHLRKNIFFIFDETFPMFQKLEYLNLRQNLIQKLQQIQKTKQLPSLKELIFSQNPLITKYEYYLFDIINANLRLQRINKINITKSVKLRAFKHAQEMWKAAQEQRKRIEQAQKLKAEQQANQQAA